MADPRINPLEPPYADDLQATFDRIMPPGVQPLALFRTLARSPRVWEKFLAASLLDRGPVPLRLREIVIDRVSARCGNEYEWGVHVTLFADRVGLTGEQLAAIVHEPASAPCWSDDERAAIRLADALHDTAGIPDDVWADVRAHFSVEQILELIALCGFYRTVAYFCNGLALGGEPFAAVFPER